jgi:hypothetical protein
VILKGLVWAKATFYAKTDTEERRHRELTGLGTLVVFAENDECHRSDLIWSINESVSISPQE